MPAAEKRSEVKKAPSEGNKTQWANRKARHAAEQDELRRLRLATARKPKHREKGRLSNDTPARIVIAAILRLRGTSKRKTARLIYPERTDDTSARDAGLKILKR